MVEPNTERLFTQLIFLRVCIVCINRLLTP
ncbi:hypothetical protein EMIT0P260_20495 [Pseudomonas sp. IT-P260]